MDNRFASPSLTPPVVPIWTPRPTKKKFAALEMHKDALTVPGLLEHAIVTSMFLEWTVYYDVESREAKKIGGQIDAELAAVLSK
ncbi:hypothetical protein BLS_008149 [Venturia inaequalis]|uniref:Uncharacterized protein n=1 Tax=Venturia inaequalis TaxID=5025 RepID=A0A8H3YNL8_VENIN|nr:hypothetical protein BLS_008149 [Venturia inaequalis]